MQGKRFQKRVETFVCEKCKTIAKGTGYTDHCPRCLWSKHVDINPGDRKSECGGMMEPVEVEVKRGEYIIHYRCIRCGYTHRVKASPEDNFEEMLKVAKKPFGI